MRTAGNRRVPAAERLATTLLERIEQGEYPPETWLPTERELAAEFRADRSTIRAALSALAERQIIMREPGRRPRVASRSAVTTDGEGAVSLQTIAVLIPQTPGHPASPAIQHGALQSLRRREAPHRLVVFDNAAETLPETIRRERQALKAITEEGFRKAIVWHQGNIDTLPDLRRVQEAGVSLVLVDRLPPAFACDFVGIDNTAAARDAVNFLLDLGHRRIMHLTMDDPTMTVRDRERGYREALMERGIYPSAGWIYRLSLGSRLQPPVVAAVNHFLSMPELPTAIFALNDLIAHALIVELQARGRHVPNEISVIGFDDVDRYSPSPASLTTVHQPFEQMGRKAVEILLDRAEAPARMAHVYLQVLLSTQLNVRSSCRSWSAGSLASDEAQP